MCDIYGLITTYLLESLYSSTNTVAAYGGAISSNICRALKKAATVVSCYINEM